MAAAIPDFDLTRVSIGLAFAAYESDKVRLASHSLAGATHLVTTRKGLYAVNEREWSIVAHGFFFGITFHEDDIYLFESCDQPHSFLRRGRIVCLKRDGNNICSTTILAKGLDNGCHQIDFLGDRLHVVDTYNQVILRFASGLSSGYETLTPLPTVPTGRWDNQSEGYAHVNSILEVDGSVLLLLHNTSEHTGRESEVAVYSSSDWRPVARWKLEGRSCHGLATLEDGTLLTCDSLSGDLISASGLRVRVSPYMTRGLAVGPDSVVVGASRLAPRADRINSSGTVTFMDRQYAVRSVLDLPGAPTEVRRLDGLDSGLSRYLQQVAWGKNLKEGRPV